MTNFLLNTHVKQLELGAMNMIEHVTFKSSTLSPLTLKIKIQE